MTEASGNSYDGDWIENKREGFGTYRSADGRVYVGEFKNDKQYGTTNSSLIYRKGEDDLRR